jgi:hypothetical protein
LDALELIEGETREAPHDAFTRSLGSDFEHVPGLQVADNRRVTLPSRDGFLIESDVLGDTMLAPHQATSDGA